MTDASRVERGVVTMARRLAGLEAVLFDMDGTLIDSAYDWPEIRSRLQVVGGSIIDELNGLAEPERSEKWRRLDEIEREASAAASLKSGVHQLLELLAGHGIASALVTNNSEANTCALLDRFGLRFDLVMSRDSGLWKPSGAPLTEAMKRLGVRPENTMAVGDSVYDIRAAREAGCGTVCLVHDGKGAHIGDADLSFHGIVELAEFLSGVL